MHRLADILHGIILIFGGSLVALSLYAMLAIFTTKQPQGHGAFLVGLMGIALLTASSADNDEK
jgi:uncharacterized membrane protein YgdD (TMEM256/DUF423 family)